MICANGARAQACCGSCANMFLLILCLAFEQCHYPYGNADCRALNFCLLCIYGSCDRLPYCRNRYSFRCELSSPNAGPSTNFERPLPHILTSVCMHFTSPVVCAHNGSDSTQFSHDELCIKQTCKMGLVGSRELHKCAHGCWQRSRTHTLIFYSWNAL